MSYNITYHEESDGTVVLKYTGDVQLLVDACASEMRGHREQGKPKSDLRRTMSLDPVVMMQIAQENGLDFYDPAVFDIASGRDYSRFRCIEDKLMWKTRARKAAGSKIITLG